MKQTPIFWSRSEKALIVVSVIIVALGIGFIHWLEHHDDLPAIAIPTPVMPSPNAFDFFNKAGSSITDSSKIGYAISTYRPHKPDGPDDHLYSQAEKVQLVRENAVALQTLRRGFAYPYMNPPARSFYAVFPYYAKERSLARLLTLESQVKAGSGDWGGAVSSNLDAVQIGFMVPRGSTELGSLVGIACEAIGRRPIWHTYEHLKAAQARSASQRLERLESQDVPFADTLQQEKWFTQAGLLEVLRAPNWAHQMATIVSDGSGPDRVVEAKILLTPKRHFIDDYTNFMNQAIAISRQPYAVDPKWPVIPNDPFSQAMLPNFSYGRLLDTNERTQNTLLMTTLALRAYKLEHGTYPATLGLLTPGYLKVVPSDPFAVSGPLGYRRTRVNYVLYSVGPDGKDDGGKPIFDPAQTSDGHSSSDRRYFVTQDSKGDIIAGINIY